MCDEITNPLQTLNDFLKWFHHIHAGIKVNPCYQKRPLKGVQQTEKVQVKRHCFQDMDG